MLRRRRSSLSHPREEEARITSKEIDQVEERTNEPVRKIK
jgi:hypothetical protein